MHVIFPLGWRFSFVGLIFLAYGVALQWWYSQIQRYIVGTDFFADGDQSLHASKASRQSMVHSVLENIGLTYVGVHVRRGHKWVEQDPVPLDSYLAACAVMAAKLNTTDVLLVTEDPAVVRMVETRVNGTRAGIVWDVKCRVTFGCPGIRLDQNW